MTAGPIGLGSLPDRGGVHRLGAVYISQGDKTPYAWNDTERVGRRSFMPRGTG